MLPLRILVCGDDRVTLQPLAQRLSDEGVKVRITTSLLDFLYRSRLEWDFLLVDMDRLTGQLRGLLPAFRRQFPNLHIVGISTKPAPQPNYPDDNLELDGYLFNLPRPEDLIAGYPWVAANYLSEAEPA